MKKRKSSHSTISGNQTTLKAIRILPTYDPGDDLEITIHNTRLREEQILADFRQSFGDGFHIAPAPDYSRLRNFYS